MSRGCENCGESVEGRRRHAVYCSGRCRAEASRKRAASKPTTGDAQDLETRREGRDLDQPPESAQNGRVRFLEPVGNDIATRAVQVSPVQVHGGDWEPPLDSPIPSAADPENARARLPRGAPYVVLGITRPPECRHAPPWWQTHAGRLVCGRCHPPAFEALVARWIDNQASAAILLRELHPETATGDAWADREFSG